MATFIKKGRTFSRLANETNSGSINSTAKSIGYSPIKLHTYLIDFDRSNNINVILLEVFTDNVIAVMTLKEVHSLSIKEVNSLMKDFDYNHEYSSYTVQDILLKGIKEKSLDLDYLARTLAFDGKDKNGVYYSEKIDVKLFFNNGVLASFEYDNDLNKWARYIKSINPDIIAGYAEEAKYYWEGDYKNIFHEINSQADAFASTPEAFNNKYIKQHISKFGNVDFIMLLVCHYGRKMFLSEFQKINFGRYKLLLEKKERKVFQKNAFKYEFDEDGILIKVRQY